MAMHSDNGILVESVTFGILYRLGLLQQLYQGLGFSVQPTL